MDEQTPPPPPPFRTQALPPPPPPSPKNTLEDTYVLGFVVFCVSSVLLALIAAILVQIPRIWPWLMFPYGALHLIWWPGLLFVFKNRARVGMLLGLISMFALAILLTVSDCVNHPFI